MGFAILSASVHGQQAGLGVGFNNTLMFRDEKSLFGDDHDSIIINNSLFVFGVTVFCTTIEPYPLWF